MSEEPADKHNYAYVVKPVEGELHYKITFGSDNEAFGYHSREGWFAYMRDWKSDMEKPMGIAIESKK